MYCGNDGQRPVAGAHCCISPPTAMPPPPPPSAALDGSRALFASIDALYSCLRDELHQLLSNFGVLAALLA